LFACVYVPNFLAQAALRLEPGVAAQPFAVVAGMPPQVRVVALNARAAKLGLWVGMTRTEVEALTGVQIRERSTRLESSAHAALIDCVSNFSPRCEDVADDTVILDISGLSKLIGTPVEIARGLRGQARKLALYIRVGVAGNIDSAIHAARTAKSISLLPFGREAELLRDAPLEILSPSPETGAILSRWGIRTFGQLAALPQLALSERLGQEGLLLQGLAQGRSMRILTPI
jgi:protein ImuB